MPDFIQKPDDKFIDDAQSYLSDLWRGAHEDWVTLDSFFQRTFNVWQRSSDAAKIVRPDYRPSKPANIIKHAVDNMMTQKIAVLTVEFTLPIPPGSHRSAGC